MERTEAPTLRGATLYFDCASGIAGDMTVGALVDLGVPAEVVEDGLARLDVGGYRIELGRVVRGGMAGTRFRVIVDGEPAHGIAHAHAAPARDEHADGAPAHAADAHAHPHGDGAPGHSGEAHAHPHDPSGHAHARGAHADEHAHDAPSEARDGHGHGHAHAHPHAGRAAHAHVHYRDIRRLIERSSLGEGVRRRALAIFDRIAAVEARIHAVTVEEVAFHEVGAIDSIVDIVGAAIALDWLAPVRVVARRVALGRGTVRTAHGLLPVPAPATLELLVGAPVEDGGSDSELTTPTGAAVLAATVDAWGPLPPITVAAVGWGAGERELPDRPNLLRVVAGHLLAPALAGADPPVEQHRGAGEPVTAAGDGRATAAAALDEPCLVVEANVDDMTPELAAPLVDALLAAGALDAWLAPVLMKKGRPGLVVAALAPPAAAPAVEAALLRESTTFGLRRHAVSRTVLPRRFVEVATRFGAVPVKVAGQGDGETASPEFEVCRRLAAEHAVPVRRVHAEAIAAFYRR